MSLFHMSVLTEGFLLLGVVLWYALLVWAVLRHGPQQGWAIVAASILIGILVALDAWCGNEPEWLFTLPVVTLILLFGGAACGVSLVRHYASMTTRYG